MTVIYNNLDVARRLIQGGARIDAQDDRGRASLMIAAKYRRLEIAQLLLDAGANGRIRDDTGKTAAAWVPDGGHDTEERLRTLLVAAAPNRLGRSLALRQLVAHAPTKYLVRWSLRARAAPHSRHARTARPAAEAAQ